MVPDAVLPGAGLDVAAVPAPSRLATPSAAHPPARSRGQTASHLSLISVVRPKGPSCHTHVPRTAHGTSVSAGGSPWLPTRLDSYGKTPVRGPGELSPSESTTPVGPHPCVCWYRHVRRDPRKAVGRAPRSGRLQGCRGRPRRRSMCWFPREGGLQPLWVRDSRTASYGRTAATLDERTEKPAPGGGAAVPWKHTVELYPTATSRRYLGKAMAAVRPHKHLLTSERTRLTTTHPVGQ